MERWQSRRCRPTFDRRRSPPARANANFLETFPFFAAAVLAVVAAGAHTPPTVIAAQLYFWARLLYLPVYIAEYPTSAPRCGHYRFGDCCKSLRRCYKTVLVESQTT